MFKSSRIIIITVLGFLATTSMVLSAPKVANPVVPDVRFVAKPQTVSVSDDVIIAAVERDTFSAEAAPKPTVPVFVVPASPAPVGEAQAYAASQVSGDQFGCLVELWNHESGWRTNAHNASSGAYGIPQALPGNKMASYGDDWMTSYVTQINWGLAYVNGRYGSPCGAWEFFLNNNWY